MFLHICFPKLSATGARMVVIVHHASHWHGIMWRGGETPRAQTLPHRASPLLIRDKFGACSYTPNRGHQPATTSYSEVRMPRRRLTSRCAAVADCSIVRPWDCLLHRSRRLCNTYSLDLIMNTRSHLLLSAGCFACCRIPRSCCSRCALRYRCYCSYWRWCSCQCTLWLKQTLCIVCIKRK